MSPEGPFPGRRPKQLRSDEYMQLQRLVKGHAGLHLSSKKRQEVELKLAQWLRPGLNGAGLLADLARSPERLQELAEELTVGETYFYRNRPQRTHVIPTLIRDAGAHRKLSFWSAGCATGEEPYSLAMLLDQHFPMLDRWSIHIRGSDLNRQFLERARQAVYSRWSLRSLEPELVERYFTRTNSYDPSSDYSHQLVAKLKRRVTVAEHNLNVDLDPPNLPPGGFDLILCRNVLIYFDRPDSDRVITRLIGALRPGGYLFVGHVDSYPALGALDAEYKCGTFYYRKPTCPKPHRTSETQLIPGLAVRSVPPGATTTGGAVTPPKKRSTQRHLTPKRTTTPPAGEQTEDALNRARVQANTGQAAAALTSLQRLAERSGRLDHRVHFLRALVADQAGLRAQAQQSLRQALFLKRDFVVAHYFKGVVAERSQDWSVAQRCFQNAHELLQARFPDEVLEETGGLTAGRLHEILDQRLRFLRTEMETR